MVCIYCGNATHVTNSRLQRKQNAVWRRRTCDACSATVTTTEKLELGSAIIVTKGKRHEAFSRDKLFISILDSLKHRKTAIADASALTDTVITRLYPLITDASLMRDDIAQQSQKVLQNFDKAGAVHYTAFHPVKH